MDTTVLQFYPTVFVVVTDMLDMVGDMVWERIKEKAEHDVDGTVICTLPSMHLFSNPIVLSIKRPLVMSVVLSRLELRDLGVCS